VPNVLTTDTLEALGMPYEVFKADEMRARFPGIWCPDDEVALYEPNCARLRSAEGIQTILDVAKAKGADLRFNQRVLGWKAESDHVVVQTTEGILKASKLIIAAGAWASQFLPLVKKRAVPERQVLVFFKPVDPTADIPCLYWWQLHETLPHRGYGAFETDGRFKIAFHHGGATQDPDNADRVPTADDIEPVVDAVRRRIPALGRVDKRLQP
jgi:sarcosine oxidase